MNLDDSNIDNFVRMQCRVFIFYSLSALYYPQYATAEIFCCWLRPSLASHRSSLRFKRGPHYQSVTVAVFFDGVGPFVWMMFQ